MFIPFSVRFINDSNNKTADDVLTIRKVAEESYLWRFVDGREKTPHTITIKFIGNVMDRLQTMLELYVSDAQPAKEVQVDVPGCPSVLIPANEMRSNIHLIRRALGHIMDAWPERAVPPCECGPHEAASDDDMPPLMQMPTYKTPQRGRHLFFED